MSSEDDDGVTIRPQWQFAMLWPILLTWLLFLGVSFLGVPIPGVNEPHYISKARSLVDPGWCERDFFLQSSSVHWCFLLVTGWLTRGISFFAVAVVGRIVSALVLAVGWSLLCGSVGLRGWQRLVAAAVFAVLAQAGSFSGEWILGGYESKVPAWGLGWAALGLWIEGSCRWHLRTLVLSGLCCGLSLSLHPVVGGWFGLGVFGATCLRMLSSGRFRADVGTLGVFCAASILTALPGLLPALRFLLSHEVSAAVRDRSIFVQVYWRLRHHMDPVAIAPEQWGYAGLLLLVACVSGGWLQGGLRISVLCGCSGPDGSLACLQRVLMAALAAAVVGILVGWHDAPVERMTGWEWRGNLLRFYPFRLLDGMLPTAGAILLVMTATRWPGWNVSWLWKPVCVLVLFAGVLGLSTWKRPVAPAGYTNAGWRDWQAACVWLQKNTDEASLVLTPRESFAFKWLSGRAEYVCYKDCPQDPAGIVEWDQRLWRVHEWSGASLRDGRYDVGDMRALRLSTGCDYILIRGQEPFESAPEWSGEYWKIYCVN
ncbi:MAG: DUF6798 domain-containing protein [Planctomycetota bacterium]